MAANLIGMEIRSSHPQAPRPLPKPAPEPPPRPEKKAHKWLQDGVLIAKDLSGVFFGDLPTAAGMAVQLGAPLPDIFKAGGGLGMGAINLGLSALGTAVDLNQARRVFKNPNSTRYDRGMEVTHLVFTDLVPTGTNFIPVLGMHGPVATVLYLATQSLGILVDLAKVQHDIRRVLKSHLN